MNSTSLSLSQLQSLLGDRRTPPLEKWQPTETVAFPILIKDNGDWYHEGHKIERESLVKLFASVLWGQSDGKTTTYYLKTPSHLYQIAVENAPILITQADKVDKDGKAAIAFSTNTHGVLLLDDEHCPYFDEYHGELQLYVPMAHKLRAKLTATALYQLVALGELYQSGDTAVLQLDSLGQCYRLCAPDTLSS